MDCASRTYSLVVKHTVLKRLICLDEFEGLTSKFNQGPTLINFGNLYRNMAPNLTIV